MLNLFICKFTGYIQLNFERRPNSLTHSRQPQSDANNGKLKMAEQQRQLRNLRAEMNQKSGAFFARRFTATYA